MSVKETKSIPVDVEDNDTDSRGPHTLVLLAKQGEQAVIDHVTNHMFVMLRRAGVNAMRFMEPEAKLTLDKVITKMNLYPKTGEVKPKKSMLGGYDTKKYCIKVEYKFAENVNVNADYRNMIIGWAKSYGVPVHSLNSSDKVLTYAFTEKDGKLLLSKKDSLIGITIRQV